MAQHKLTDIAVRMLKPKSSSFQVSDGGGLYLKIYPNGSKSWLLRKYSGGKQTNIILGAYPDMSLAQARVAAIKKLKKLELTKIKTADMSLGGAAQEWLANKDIRLGTRLYIERDIKRLADYHELAFSEFSPAMARALIHEVIRKHGTNSALHLASTIAQIERYAYSIGVIDAPRMQMLSTMIKRPNTQHRRFVTAERLPELCAIMKEHTTTKTRMATVAKVKLLMLTLLRCNEVFNLHWEWIDLNQQTITIPAAQMKAKREHRLPISTALSKLLLSFNPEPSGFILPGKCKRDLCTPARFYNTYFATLGILPLISPHGVRSMGRTWFAEQDFNFVHCEYCLAHRVENQLQLSYQRSDYLEQRRPIMEAWGNYVESCFAPYFPEL